MNDEQISLSLLNKPHTSLSPEDSLTVVLYRLISSTISIVGSLFIIATYLAFSIKTRCCRKRKSVSIDRERASSKQSNHDDYKKLKMGYGHDMIFLIALCDLAGCISTFVKMDGNSTLVEKNSEIPISCTVQGILMNFSEVSSVCMTSIIAYSVFRGTWQDANVRKIAENFFCFFLYGFGPAVLLTVGPLITKSYGPAGPWCWLNTHQDLSSEEFQQYSVWIWSLVIYLFNWTNIGFNIFAVIKSVHYFKRRAAEIESNNQTQAHFLRKFCFVLQIFPSILILCWIFPTINRILLFFTQQENLFLFCATGFSSSLVGFLNAIAYSFYYKDLFKDCCKTRKRASANLLTTEERKSAINHTETSKPQITSGFL